VVGQFRCAHDLRYGRVRVGLALQQRYYLIEVFLHEHQLREILVQVHETVHLLLHHRDQSILLLQFRTKLRLVIAHVLLEIRQCPFILVQLASHLLHGLLVRLEGTFLLTLLLEQQSLISLEDTDRLLTGRTSFRDGRQLVLQLHNLLPQLIL
jgi:hypothetical protein